jgi:NAD(P)-dependent dehydrogenase (short-subunit alcohol dehydrogenase family)
MTTASTGGTAARVALVTGAGRGIGRGIALRLASDGLAVAVNDVNSENATAVSKEIEAAGGRSVAVAADVTDRDAVFDMVARTADTLGGLDVMVANAGIAQVKTLLEVTPADLRRIFEVNVFGVVYCMQAAAERFIAQGHGGKIISVHRRALRVRLSGPLLGHQVRRPSPDPGRRARAGAAPDHGECLLPWDRRHRDVGADRRAARRLPGHREG